MHCHCPYWHIPYAEIRIENSTKKHGDEHQLLHPIAKDKLELAAFSSADAEDYQSVKVSLAKLFLVLRKFM
jgi:hypothetical protein